MLIPAVLRVLGLASPVLTDVVEGVAPVVARAPGAAIRREAAPGSAGTITCGAHSIGNPARGFLVAPWHVVPGASGRSGDPILSIRICPSCSQ
jgi:hypothetical protein